MIQTPAGLDGVFLFLFFFPFFSAFEKNNENEKNNVCQNLKKKKICLQKLTLI